MRMRLFEDNQTTSRWSALDGTRHPLCSSDPTVEQPFNQVSTTTQSNDETIVIKDSCDLEVHPTLTEAAVPIQLALQVAIALVLEVSIADSIDTDELLQDLLQLTRASQSNRTKTVIENSRNVKVTTTNTDIAVQILVALLLIIDVLYTQTKKVL